MTDAKTDAPEATDSDFVSPSTKKEQQEAKAVKDLSGGKKEELTMEVSVASPFSGYFEGPAFSISGLNATGPFDILPKHHNFISLLLPCTLVIRTAAGNEKKIAISGGLMHVKSDKVTVFLDI